MKSGRVSACQEETPGVTEKGQQTKFHLQPLTWAPAEEGQSGLETLEESLELVVLKIKLKEQPPGALC